jgi:RES domain-containing protein
MTHKPAHHSFDDLLSAIKAWQGIGRPWSGNVYRLSDPKYAKKHKLASGVGSYENGGRWNAPDSFHAVYASLAVTTAIIEAESWARHFNVETHTIYPKVIVSLNVSLENIFDLTSGSRQSHLRGSLKNMLKCDWRSENQKGREALTQAIGQAIFIAGFEGILAPSSADPKGVNLVCFPKRLGATSYIKCVNEEKL